MQLRDKNFLTCGSWVISYSGNQPRNKGLLVKFDISGNIIWSKKYDPVSFYNGIGYLYELPDGDIMMTGKADTNYYNVKPQILRTDKNGNVKWQKHTGHFENEVEGFYSMHPTADKGFVFASAVPLMSSLKPYGIIKIDSTGCDTVEQWCKSIALGIGNFTKLSGFNVELFPNPASGFVNLKVDAPQSEGFVIKLNDVSGRLLVELALETNNTLEINTSGYKAGVYFVSIFYEGRMVEMKRLVVVR
ncbi:T9SS type A sorting domain-containing protein [Aurantibacillus circumpalustris]|uniref:T9SS type A sorting domain-containing protein n=1 Tax=Aurantibacillus circumpalustris TaxID=3036359 RepID=UPI00295B2459|nr:T9SS type A sorting domain-containing protein [Aurantibacillus circumpalustris]